MDQSAKPRRLRITPTLLITLLGVYGAITIGLVTVAILSDGKPAARAVIGMAWGLILLWVILGGLLMRRNRDRVRAFILRIPLGWRVKFVLFATILALIEEAITTTMTNLAPIFGVRVGEAYITASANYLNVVLLHSVVVIVPMFIGWTWLLARYDFSPAAVMLLFGLSGTVAELSLGGFNPGLWVFVYGLMIYLPAYSLPERAGLRKPNLLHCILAILLPILCAVPVAGIVHLLHPIDIEFPPMQT